MDSGIKSGVQTYAESRTATGLSIANPAFCHWEREALFKFHGSVIFDQIFDGGGRATIRINAPLSHLVG